ncbi:MAG: LysR family transcriptional regulator [Geminicoccaceae bacterium]|nr:LysR family transcriptional regulator [Geminicoccaceae bacterium]
MDRLQGMEVFIKVAQQGGLSAAAGQLGMAKSTVSKHVAALEARLGVRLLNRTTRQLALTEFGQRYLETVLPILQSLEEAECSLARLSVEPKGRLRVNAPMSFGQRHLAPALVRFMRRYPDIRVDLTLNDRRVDLIEEGYDVALRIGRLEDSGLMARRLARLPRVCAASPVYLAEAGTPEAPEDLRGHNCLRYAYSPTPSEWIFEDGDGEKRVRIDGGFAANNGDVLTQAAIAGLGVVYHPRFLVEAALRDGRLVPLLQAYAAPAVDLHAVFAPQRPPPLKIRILVDFLVAAFKDLEAVP